MINYHTSLVDTLSAVLPTYYEMTLKAGTKTPCISYMELNNYVEANGDSLGYSRITYQVKIWGNRIQDLQKYAVEVDNALRTIGFKRVSSGELYDNASTMIQKILTYEALALEDFKEAK